MPSYTRTTGGMKMAHRTLVQIVALIIGLMLRTQVAGAACGDGILDPGEECDPGPDVPGDCCTSGCTLMVTCPATDECHDAGTCDVTTGLCSNPAKPDGTTCNSIGVCRDGRCTTPMAIRVVWLRGYQSDAHRGAVWVSGRFPIVDPDSVSVGSGIAVRLQDAASLDHAIHWLPEECHPRLRGVLCITRPAEKIQLPVRPGYYGVKLRLLGLPIYAPFQPPVTVTIMQDSGVDRVGTISDCTQRANGGLNCQQQIGP